jgi:cytochrome P450
MSHLKLRAQGGLGSELRSTARALIRRRTHSDSIAAPRALPGRAGDALWHASHRAHDAFLFYQDPIGFARTARDAHGSAAPLPDGTVLLTGAAGHRAFFGARYAHERPPAWSPTARLVDAVPVREPPPRFGALTPGLSASRMRIHGQRALDVATRSAPATTIGGLLDVERDTATVARSIAYEWAFGSSLSASRSLSLRSPGPARPRSSDGLARLAAATIDARRRGAERGDDLSQALAEDPSVPVHEGGRLLQTLVETVVVLASKLSRGLGHELHRLPDHIPPLRAELRRVHGRRARSAVRGELTRQALLRAALLEAERLHPPVQAASATLESPVWLDGQEVPAGRLAMLVPAISHRLPELFADPDRFEPARFTGEPGRWGASAGLVVGFGNGFYRAVARPLVRLLVTAVWTAWLDRLELEPEPVSPDHGAGGAADIRFRYRRRD